MTEKRPVGKPRKYPVEQKIENPDCKPATKGFVKSLMRNTYEHKHRVNVETPWCLLGALICWCYVFIAYVIAWAIQSLSIPYKFSLGLEHAFALAIAIVLTVVAVDMCESTCYTGSTYGDDTPLRKYEPPKCKETKECE